MLHKFTLFAAAPPGLSTRNSSMTMALDSEPPCARPFAKHFHILNEPDGPAPRYGLFIVDFGKVNVSILIRSVDRRMTEGNAKRQPEAFVRFQPSQFAAFAHLNGLQNTHEAPRRLLLNKPGAVNEIDEGCSGPSMNGISGALTSTRQLSTPSPEKALIKCSIVATAARPTFTVVAMRVSFTFMGAAGISTGGLRSTRRKTIPESSGAG